MRITSKGQVTIPVEIRERAGFLPNTEVDFILEGSSVRVVKAPARKGESRGARLVRGLSGKAGKRLTTEQLLVLTRGK
jgi:AbrB family looped-hinge helix DNA binding protein